MNITVQTHPKDPKNDDRCRVCEAQATGFHFDAQSCSACAAFFRRTISLNKKFVCIANRSDCKVHYSMHQICRSCRFEKCLKAGMNTAGVQPRKGHQYYRRTFCTKSGLKRNKRFAVVAPMSRDEREQIEEVVLSPRTSLDGTDGCSSVASPGEKFKGQSGSSTRISSPLSFVMRNEHDDVLTWLVREEMKLGERRRILFCERPVDKVLGQTSNCPYTREDIRPLSFRSFRKSIRTHILLIYEWLQAWPDYRTLGNNDKVSFLRKCVLFHTILDPVYISIQIGYPDRFVMQNGGYVSCVEGCEDGWQGEKEISTDVKKSIYLPLLKKIMSEIIPPMLSLELSFEEFVALKAFVSWQGAISNISIRGRDAMRRQIDAISNSLHLHYKRNNIPAAERMGSIILLLSSIFSTGLDFVESHRQIEFFDLWHLDSLLLQFLNLDSILAELNSAQC
ncbi:Ligand-binding domain of nuclear hormone receptor [Trichostrongylus colubriformis]|uniref:Ligand-binding domain of nuclear hormone receptor n=1 Tax=Trichostrongylus colubriformis TaxID=6319 RepID=A0AAN8F136_TRICO